MLSNENGALLPLLVAVVEVTLFRNFSITLCKWALVLENALQRYDNAYAYMEQFLALQPDNTRGLLMKLHFATMLGKRDSAQAVIATLQEMDQQGKLTVAQQQTLAMYL